MGCDGRWDASKRSCVVWSVEGKKHTRGEGRGRGVLQHRGAGVGAAVKPQEQRLKKAILKQTVSPPTHPRARRAGVRGSPG